MDESVFAGQRRESRGESHRCVSRVSLMVTLVGGSIAGWRFNRRWAPAAGCSQLLPAAAAPPPTTRGSWSVGLYHSYIHSPEERRWPVRSMLARCCGGVLGDADAAVAAAGSSEPTLGALDAANLE